MPRDCLCSNCGGAFHEDEMEDGMMCIYCSMGIESGLNRDQSPEPDPDPTE